jgi:hypothetical protein
LLNSLNKILVFNLNREPKATIGYVYDDSSITSGFNSNVKKPAARNESKLPLNDLTFDSDDELELGLILLRNFFIFN